MQWLSLVLGGGGVAFIAALGRGVQVLLDHRERRSAKLMDELELRRQSAIDDAEWYVDLAEHWRNRAGDLEYQLRSSGIDPVLAKPLPLRPPPRIQEK